MTDDYETADFYAGGKCRGDAAHGMGAVIAGWILLAVLCACAMAFARFDE